jgi:hypothetical protein
MELRIVIYKNPNYSFDEEHGKPWIGAVVTSDETYNKSSPYSGNIDPSNELDAETFADYGEITKRIRQLVYDYYSVKSSNNSSSVGEENDTSKFPSK